MKLQDALDRLDQLADDDVIFARKPWSLDADAEISQLDANHRVPVAMTNIGLDYFIEASVASEVLEVFGTHQPTIDERRDLLMYYAEHDAYPQWVYKI